MQYAARGMMLRDAESGPADDAGRSITIALRIPGVWDGPDALALALPDDFDITERGLHMPDGSLVEVFPMKPDDQFVEIFAKSCERRPSEADRERIERYTVNVCLRSLGGSVEDAARMLAAGAAIIHAGGAGVFVDNSGVAHGSDDWLALAEDSAHGGVFWAYVATIGSEEDVWSLGMHVLGYRDAVMPRSGDDEFDHLRINEFLGYTYRSGAVIRDGDLIGGHGGPEFRLLHEDILDIPDEHPMFNPFGRWRLVPVETPQHAG